MDNKTMEEAARATLGDDLFIEEISKALTPDQWREVLDWICCAWDITEPSDLGY